MKVLYQVKYTEICMGLSGCSEIGETCLMLGKCSPNLESGGKTIDWVICEMCQSWYHSACIGLDTQIITQNDFKFSCCTPPVKNEMYELLYWFAVEIANSFYTLTYF